MKFDFQFESLLKIRHHEEQKEQQALGEMLAQKQKVEKKIYDCRKEIAEGGQMMPEEGQHKASAIRRRYAVKQDVHKRLWNMRQKYSDLLKNIAKQRDQLMQANKNTRMLEKMKARERTKFLELYQEIEQKEQNEIATQMYNRAK